MMYKNIEKSVVLKLADQVDYKDGQVSSKTLSQNPDVSVTLFSFSKNEEISTHTSHGDAMVTILEGTAKITVDGIDHRLTAGETIVMPAEHPHALFALENFKMILTVVFPKKH